MMRLARVKQKTSTDRNNKGFRDAYRLLLHIYKLSSSNFSKYIQLFNPILAEGSFNLPSGGTLLSSTAFYDC